GRVQLTVRRMVEGARREVLEIAPDTLSPAHVSTPSTPEAPPPPRNGVESWGTGATGAPSLPHGLPHADPLITASGAAPAANGVDGVVPHTIDPPAANQSHRRRRGTL